VINDICDEVEIASGPGHFSPSLPCFFQSLKGTVAPFRLQNSSAVRHINLTAGKYRSRLILYPCVRNRPAQISYEPAPAYALRPQLAADPRFKALLRKMNLPED
jgi:hypothetical protein